MYKKNKREKLKMNVTSDIVVDFLKQNNINTKNLYVRCNKIISYCQTIDVILKDLTLNDEEIQELLDKQFISDEREKRTGNFLTGENTYISVYYEF